ncbi:unnamed protein product [Arctogadus glacialis]
MLPRSPAPLPGWGFYEAQGLLCRGSRLEPLINSSRLPQRCRQRRHARSSFPDSLGRAFVQTSPQGSGPRPRCRAPIHPRLAARSCRLCASHVPRASEANPRCALATLQATLSSIHLSVSVIYPDVPREH